MARLLFVHAHPDDEILTCGVTMAHHVAAGDEVHVLTCTLGEEGDVIPPELAHLQGAAGDPLAPWRREELREAMHRIGAAHTVLGEDPAAGVLSRYRDSGMAGMPAAHHPRAFAAAPVAEAAARVAEHLRALAPDVVVTYDEQGGYGHPDHIQTRRVTMAALAGLAIADRPERVYEIRTPQSWAVEDRDWLAAYVRPQEGLTLLSLEDPYPPSVGPEDQVTNVVVDTGVRTTQEHALAAHRTQLRVFQGYYALSNNLAARLAGREGFTRIDPWASGGRGAPSTTRRSAPLRRTGGGWVEGLLAGP
ncbi:MAG: PIG-L family deacetylase [Lapillicoccus sp.]